MYIADETAIDDNYIAFKHKRISEKHGGMGTLFYVMILLDSEIDEHMNKVGDSLKKLQGMYPEDLTKDSSDEECYVYLPQNIGVNRIYFYLKKDIITKITLENGIDG